VAEVSQGVRTEIDAAARGLAQLVHLVRVPPSGTWEQRRANRYALAERCSHLGGPLADGMLEDGCIQCPWHGSRFALEDGRPIDGPASIPQPCFETRVRNGRIEVRAAD